MIFFFNKKFIQIRTVGLYDRSNKHIRTKLELTPNARVRMLGPLSIRNKCTALGTKLLIYKFPLKPIWTLELQIIG